MVGLSLFCFLFVAAWPCSINIHANVMPQPEEKGFTECSEQERNPFFGRIAFTCERART